MATNDDLDDFFKKKDRKGHKNKKQTGLLTNNEELLKQLVIVTSATTAFKENLDLPEDEDDELQVNHEMAVVGEPHKHPTHHSKAKTSDDNPAKQQSNGQQATVSDNSNPQQQQQDEWEDFVDSNAKYEQIRSKLAANANDEDEEEYDNENDANGENPNANNETNLDREYSKDKPVWKTSDMKQSTEVNVPTAIVQDKPEEASVKPTASSVGAYRPPQMRSSGASGSVTVVSGPTQRTNKKKEPNLASTDEFPTLGATVNKK